MKTIFHSKNNFIAVILESLFSLNIKKLAIIKNYILFISAKKFNRTFGEIFTSIMHKKDWRIKNMN